MKHALLSLLMISALAFTGCSDTEFSTAISDNQQTEDPTLPTTPDRTVVNFSRDVNTTNVDMIWVIDNSVSMAEEIQIIKDNLSEFLLSIEDRSKLNFTLITNNRGNYGMALSPSALAKGYKQIAERIDSRDSLIRLVELIPQMLGTSIRSNSKKVVVVVTDDNSDLSANMFLKAITKFFRVIDFKLFGFVGLDRTQSKCIDNVGKAYIDLAVNTGGRAFNICETDWHPYFEALVKDVGEITKTEFTLPSRPKGQIVVKIDGVATTKYTLNARTLVIHPDNFVQNKKYNIEVSYLPLK